MIKIVSHALIVQVDGPSCTDLCADKNENCTKCLRNGDCFECKDEYYFGKDCTPCPNCPGGCNENEDGKCNNKDDRCIDGLHYGPSCTDLCADKNENCTKCERNGDCFECINEFYFGKDCTPCFNCPGGCDNTGQCKDGPSCTDLCADKNENCTKCLRNGDCFECKDEYYYGKNCTPCPNCPGGCNKNDNGICNDENSRCPNPLYYGPSCTDLCNDKNDNCTKCERNGDCFECINEYYYGKNCTPCFNCPDGCDENGKCNDENATCKDEIHYGPSCTDLCADKNENCTKCERNGDCFECKDEYYFGKDCTPCFNCPGGCNWTGICNDENATCKDEIHYGPSCTDLCADKNENCTKCERNGDCFECKDEYYFGKDCTPCFNCPGGCNWTGICIDENATCKDEIHYGPSCTDLCADKNENCTKCERNGDCFECKDVYYYGPDCAQCFNCPGGCNWTGICNDENTTCVDEIRYGPSCDMLCSDRNENCTKCNRTGDCFECISEYYYGPNCTQCFNCPDGCKDDGICNDETSNCNNDLYYGPSCNQLCSDRKDNCLQCNRTGACTSCKINTFYDINCTSPCDECPGGCHINGTCLNESENCNNASFYGPMCQDLCSDRENNCDKCNRIGECFICKNNAFYGINCTTPCDQCPGGCDINGKCVSETENCLNASFYGPMCTDICSDRENNCNKCNRTGQCFECKNNEFYGIDCTTPCDQCPGGCDINGKCVSETENCKNASYYGPMCTDICYQCDKCYRNGECFECKNDSFYGKECKDKCFDCPGGCENNGKCKDQEHNCLNVHFYGDFCNQSCSEIHHNCSTCNRNKTCISCLKNQSYGEKCEYTCENCTNGECDMEGYCLDKTQCAKNFYFGPKCTLNCKKNCSEDGCDVKGNCEKNCSKDHYNMPACDFICESNCINNSCFDNGTCFGCQDKTFYRDFCNVTVGEDDEEYKNCNESTQFGEECISCRYNNTYGNKCESICSEGCSDKSKITNLSMCSKEDGRCDGCTLTYFGPFCKEKCDGCGDYGCDDLGYCKEFKCLDGKYGLKCDQKCDCESNSNSLACGKFSGECQNCAFGYFGRDCQKQCNYKCQTGLCCIFYSHNLKAEFTLDTNYRYLEVEMGDSKFKIEIDYNYGYPLTLFEKGHCGKINNVDLTGIKGIGQKDSMMSINFANYYIKGDLYNSSTFSINGKEFSDIDIIITQSIECKEPSTGVDGANGVIGLGFFNSLSNRLFLNKTDRQNILSYSLNKENIKLIFGSMPKEQTDYIEKLTTCKVVFEDNTDIQGKTMSCELNGIKSERHSYGLEIKDTKITFSLGQNSSLVLFNDNIYKNYLKNEYFDEKVEEHRDEKTNNIYYLYPANKINKLRNFGFVFNNFFYSYEPNLFFEKNSKNGKKRFLIEFSDKKSEVILGKEFLNDIKFTINNEEARIYFYAKNAELCEKLVYQSSQGFRIQLEAREIAAIFLSVVIFINIVAFVVYYFLKKKKMNSNDYIRID